MADSDQNKLYVGGISKGTTEDALKAHFLKYGAVVAAVVAKDRETGNPRGFGFVSLEDSSAVERALGDTHCILERMVEVSKAIPRSEQHQNQQQSRRSYRNSGGSCGRTDVLRTKKIFVGGLAPSVTEREFRGYFERFGLITDVVVMHDNATNRPRGFGFITFDSEEAVDDVTKKSFHELSGKLVEVKRAVPKEGNNGNCHNDYNARVGGGRDSFNNYQDGNYPPYSPQCGILPGYGPFPGYGGSVGYPYGTNFFGVGFPFGGCNGIGYGVTPLAPRSPWIRGGILPYVNFPVAYPAYMNGGVGVVGIGTNGYDGIGQTGMNGQLSQVGSCSIVEVDSLDIGGSDSDDAQVTADATMNGETVNVKSLDTAGSDGDTSSNGNEEGIDGQLGPR
ncbi:hypothetical protein RHMOL_Rhmol06G0079700 [Rhododendron molle]|uniref:Uncharacterized protein n=1 Tax=Rhododendron molle TaxID=49168 RepID=A0ACC0NBF1_RHOML|nr:hypothetical protein RHMOL_Rhmol06G0079700 [Rhododendron molle]